MIETGPRIMLGIMNVHELTINYAPKRFNLSGALSGVKVVSEPLVAFVAPCAVRTTAGQGFRRTGWPDTDELMNLRRGSDH